MGGGKLTNFWLFWDFPHTIVVKTLLLYLNLLYAFTEICMTSSLLMIEIFVIQFPPEIS